MTEKYKIKLVRLHNLLSDEYFGKYPFPNLPETDSLDELIDILQKERKNEKNSNERSSSYLY